MFDALRLGNLLVFSGLLVGTACNVGASGTPGLAGESCESRLDCAAELACFVGICADSQAAAAALLELGQQGESCTRRADCREPLACVANVCVQDPTSAESAGGMTTTGSAEGGTGETGLAGVGEACALPEDCQAGLDCIANICMAGDHVDPDGHGGKGESCRTSRDCAAPLVCIRGTCGPADFDVEPTNKECVLIACEEPKDCCPPPPSSCDTLDELCEAEKEAGMEGPACAEFERLCVCDENAWSCKDDRCVAETPCGTDEECIAGVCEAGKCVACSVDEDCPLQDQACVDNSCVAGCDNDSQCPALHECNDGECVEVGCRDNRECIACTGSVYAFCDGGACRQPCERDAECGSPEDFNYRACVEGFCQDVGCATDQECKIILLGNNPNGIYEAVCRERVAAPQTLCSGK